MFLQHLILLTCAKCEGPRSSGSKGLYKVVLRCYYWVFMLCSAAVFWSMLQTASCLPTASAITLALTFGHTCAATVTGTCTFTPSTFTFTKPSCCANAGAVRTPNDSRSEERRVGKECRSRGTT